LIIARWPEPLQAEGWEEEKVGKFSLIMDVVKAIRNIRAEKQMQPGKLIPATIVAGLRSDEIKQQARTIQTLAYLDPAMFTVMEQILQKPENQISMVVSGLEIYIPQEDLTDQEGNRERLEKDLLSVTAQIERLEKLLESDFATKAPPAVVEKERQKLDDYKATREKLQGQLSH
jgi:valyl-tRNA synthetase